MDVINVQSSVISSIAYDPEEQILEVRFRAGRIYHYYKVPKKIYDRLRTAPSVGRYFNANVRDRYRSRLVYDPV